MFPLLRAAYTGSLAIFSILFVTLWGIMRCAPHPGLSKGAGIIGAQMYGLCIIFGQRVWPARVLWNKV